tara:strand:+ start:672 stop:773 length:102 start_codon:yes stop_codon:yes gene_type:complete
VQGSGLVFRDFRVKAQEDRAENPVKKTEVMAFR